MTAQKFVVSLWLIICSLFITVTPAFAQNIEPLGYVSPQSPQYANQIVFNLAHTFSCIVTGQSIIGQPCIEYISKVNSLGIKEITPILSSSNLSGGILGFTQNVLVAMYVNKPLSTSKYLSSVANNMGLTKEVHAQVPGGGSTVLDPILPLWQLSRNIAYAAMILIFVIIGLMIMFRSKINPQTVISIQAALPGLIIGLILITFSYLLASIITDISYLATNLIGFYFSLANATNLSGTLLHNVGNNNILQIYSQYIGVGSIADIQNGVRPVWDNIQGFPKTILTTALAFLSYQYGSQVGAPLGAIGGAAACAATGLAIILIPGCATLGSIIGGITTGVISALTAVTNPTFTIAIAVYVVLVAILIYSMLRLLYKLVMNYLNIIFLTITAPFHFLIASLPGRQEMATNWMRNMLCNVLAFPAVFGAFYFAAYLIGPNPNIPFGIQNTLNLTGGGALPLFGGLDVGFVRLLLFYGVLIATPTIPDIICQTVGKVGRAGQMIGSEISGATRAGQGYTNRVHGAAGEVGKGISQLQEGFVPKKGWGYIPGRGWTYTKTQPSPWEVVRTKGQPLP